MADFQGSFIILLALGIPLIHGEIRCYCNEPQCVTTGYMCKSQLGTCYTIVTYKSDVIDPSQSIVVHGCADKLSEWKLRSCTGHGRTAEDLQQNISETHTVIDSNAVEKTSEVYAGRKTELELEDTAHNLVEPTDDGNSRETITCCTADMCNYRDSEDISIIIGTQMYDANNREENRESRPRKDVWFKAAVIAVPIAGGFILILLVLLAVRMLRSDSRQHRRLIQIRRARSLTKAQLYVTDHFIDKDKKCLYGDACSSSRDHCHHNYHHSNHEHTHSQKVTTNREGKTYEQIQTDKHSTCEPKVHNIKKPDSPSVIVSIMNSSPKENKFATNV